MEDSRLRLINAYTSLYHLKGQCSLKRHHECSLGKFTFTQIEYLKIIDSFGKITISELAYEVNNSKPTVTEMVKKFIKHDCISKQKCSEDARKTYITLTKTGEDIARIEQNIINDLADIMVSKLNGDEVEIFIELLNKIGRQ